MFSRFRFTPSLYRTLVPRTRVVVTSSKMLGNPDILVTCSLCSNQNPHCKQCKLEQRSLPILHLKNGMGAASAGWDCELKAKLLIVEGNIGVGKTTLTKKLAEKLKYKIFLEPTTDNPYLEKFYADPHKFALKLQLWILYQRYSTYVEAVQHILKTDQGVILDRSIYSDRVFARVCTSEGFISSEGYEEYQYWRKRCLEHLPLPHVTIFLDASPQCCHDRIHRRARNCESGVTIEYLEKLHKEYSLFIDGLRSQGCHVLKYDWSIFKEEKPVCEAIEHADTAQWTYDKLPTDDRIIREFHLSEAP